MKNKIALAIFVAVTLLSLPLASVAQTPDLGTAANFALFSSAGAVSNTGISQITGNIGTNVGAVTGFGNVNGVMHTADATTAQAAIDLQTAWYYLSTQTPTSTIGPVLGAGRRFLQGWIPLRQRDRWSERLLSMHKVIPMQCLSLRRVVH